MNRKTTQITLIVAVMLCGVQLKAQDWTPLFNGKDLKNWEQIGGEAKYEIRGDAIVGIAVPKTRNSFLTTKETYTDFILEYEVHTDSEVNSGVQIRSNTDPNYRKGVFHGYQIELDPSDRAWSGGVYDEQRRGWLYPLTRNPEGQKAFKRAAWNKYRIQAIGNTISTWVNGVQCARLVDDMTAEGKIGLQVHSIREGSGLEGTEIKWRNVRIATTNLEELRWEDDPTVPEFSYLHNQLTDWEQSKGWRMLWDGKTSNGWKGAKLDGFPESGWSIADGVLTIEATDGAESTGPGDIVTTKNYGDFELELEFMITEGANSGIKYFVDPKLNKGAGSAIGCEFQVLDDKNHPDAKKGVIGNRTVGSLYDLIAAKNLSEPSRDGKRFNGVGRWNKARIVSRDGKVEHWLNNIKVVEYDRFSQMFAALVNYSKYQKWENFGRWSAGSILLQDHGDTVSYRSIKIREL
ncbi:MAG: DUF1080 domain-containing protein [Bacteroidota bacterium]